MKHKIYFYKLLVMPLFFASMILLGTSFSLGHNRGGKMNMMLVYALACGFLIYFFSDIITAFAISGTIPAWLSTIAPSLMALGIGLSIIIQTEEVSSS
jgi:lipopolysaccharide export system permease protein